MIASSKQTVRSLASLAFLVDFFVMLRNFHNAPTIPTVGLQLRTRWMRFPLHFEQTNKMPEACDDNLRAAFKQNVTCRKSSATATNKHIFNIPPLSLNPNGKYFVFGSACQRLKSDGYGLPQQSCDTPLLPCRLGGTRTRTTQRPLGCKKKKGNRAVCFYFQQEID